MNVDIDLWPAIQPHWWKWARRGNNTISGLIWHATRSGLAYGSPSGPYGAAWTVGWELTATMNWFRSPHNGSQGNGIAGMSNWLIGDGKLVRCVPEELVPRYSAGVHDFRGISVEVCQPLNNEPYDPRDIALCQELAAEVSGRHGFTLGRIPFVDSGNNGWPGEVGHEDTAQGRGQGKSDPGSLFWQAYEEEDWMTTKEGEDFLLAVFSGAEEASLPREERLTNARFRLQQGADGQANSVNDRIVSHVVAHPGGGSAKPPAHTHEPGEVRP